MPGAPSSVLAPSSDVRSPSLFLMFLLRVDSHPFVIALRLLTCSMVQNLSCRLHKCRFQVHVWPGICMCSFPYVFLCLFISLLLYLFSFFFLCLVLSFLPSFLPSFLLSFCLSVFLSVFLSFCLSVFLSFFLSFSLFLSFFLSFSLFLSLAIFLSSRTLHKQKQHRAASYEKS